MREARKAAAERERGCEAIVDAANLRSDPLTQLSVLRAFRGDGLDASLEWRRGAGVLEAELRFCTALLSDNMREQYRAAGWGWSDAARRAQLTCLRAGGAGVGRVAVVLLSGLACHEPHLSGLACRTPHLGAALALAPPTGYATPGEAAGVAR